MIVKLFDGSEFVISKKQGESLARSISKSSDGHVMINDHFIKKTAIAYIKPGGYSEADQIKAQENNLLKRDNRSEATQNKAARKVAERIRETIRKRGVRALKVK